MTEAVETELNATVTSAVAGDDAAFERIVSTYHEDMRRVCVVMCHDDQIVDEAVQSAWAIAWRKLETLEDHRRLRSWLVSVAVNEARQLLRRQGRRSRVEVATDTTSVEAGPDPAFDAEAMDLRRALADLDPEDRALLAMRYVAGFDSTELAAAIGLSPSGTRNRLERLLAKLRQELGDA
jgi:RNA polymerase sigma-70 factor (ECF subfamily)